jgi:septation ring formation regulator EzrA
MSVHNSLDRIIKVFPQILEMLNKVDRIEKDLNELKSSEIFKNFVEFVHKMEKDAEKYSSLVKKINSFNEQIKKIENRLMEFSNIENKIEELEKKYQKLSKNSKSNSSIENTE